jgi:hypothetical protein
MIEKYLELRRAVDTIKEKHKVELAPYVEVMTQLENELLSHLNQAGVDSTKSSKGTAYKSTATSVTVADWPKTLAYIREHELWDLLEARVAKSAAVEIIEETKRAIPGVQISQAVVLRVRAG